MRLWLSHCLLLLLVLGVSFGQRGSKKYNPNQDAEVEVFQQTHEGRGSTRSRDSGEDFSRSRSRDDASTRNRGSGSVGTASRGRSTIRENESDRSRQGANTGRVKQQDVNRFRDNENRIRPTVSERLEDSRGSGRLGSRFVEDNVRSEKRNEVFPSRSERLQDGNSPSRSRSKEVPPTVPPTLSLEEFTTLQRETAPTRSTRKEPVPSRQNRQEDNPQSTRSGRQFQSGRTSRPSDAISESSRQVESPKSRNNFPSREGVSDDLGKRQRQESDIATRNVRQKSVNPVETTTRVYHSRNTQPRSRGPTKPEDAVSGRIQTGRKSSREETTDKTPPSRQRQANQRAPATRSPGRERPDTSSTAGHRFQAAKPRQQVKNFRQSPVDFLRPTLPPDAKPNDSVEDLELASVEVAEEINHERPNKFNRAPQLPKTQRGNAKGPSFNAKGSPGDDVTDEDNYPAVYKQLKKEGKGPKEILALLKSKKQVSTIVVDQEYKSNILVPSSAEPEPRVNNLERAGDGEFPKSFQRRGNPREADVFERARSRDITRGLPPRGSRSRSWSEPLSVDNLANEEVPIKNVQKGRKAVQDQRRGPNKSRAPPEITFSLDELRPSSVRLNQKEPRGSLSSRNSPRENKQLKSRRVQNDNGVRQKAIPSEDTPISSGNSFNDVATYNPDDSSDFIENQSPEIEQTPPLVPPPSSLSESKTKSKYDSLKDPIYTWILESETTTTEKIRFVPLKPKAPSKYTTKFKDSQEMASTTDPTPVTTSGIQSKKPRYELYARDRNNNILNRKLQPTPSEQLLDPSSESEERKSYIKSNFRRPSFLPQYKKSSKGSTPLSFIPRNRSRKAAQNIEEMINSDNEENTSEEDTKEDEEENKLTEDKDKDRKSHIQKVPNKYSARYSSVKRMTSGQQLETTTAGGPDEEITENGNNEEVDTSSVSLENDNDNEVVVVTNRDESVETNDTDDLVTEEPSTQAPVDDSVSVEFDANTESTMAPTTTEQIVPTTIVTTTTTTVKPTTVKVTLKPTTKSTTKKPKPKTTTTKLTKTTTKKENTNKKLTTTRQTTTSTTTTIKSENIVDNGSPSPVPQQISSTQSISDLTVTASISTTPPPSVTTDALASPMSNSLSANSLEQPTTTLNPLTDQLLQTTPGDRTSILSTLRLAAERLSSGTYLTQTVSPTTSRNTDTADLKQTQRAGDIVVYGVLPNNDVVRKIVRTTEAPKAPFIIFGLYPNGTIVRKYPNGTVIPDEKTEANEVIGSVDTRNSRSSLEKIVARDNLSYLYPPPMMLTTATPRVNPTINWIQKINSSPSPVSSTTTNDSFDVDDNFLSLRFRENGDSNATGSTSSTTANPLDQSTTPAPTTEASTIAQIKDQSTTSTSATTTTSSSPVGEKSAKQINFDAQLPIDTTDGPSTTTTGAQSSNIELTTTTTNPPTTTTTIKPSTTTTKPSTTTTKRPSTTTTKQLSTTTTTTTKRPSTTTTTKKPSTTTTKKPATTTKKITTTTKKPATTTKKQATTTTTRAPTTKKQSATPKSTPKSSKATAAIRGPITDPTVTRTTAKPIVASTKKTLGDGLTPNPSFDRAVDELDFLNNLLKSEISTSGLVDEATLNSAALADKVIQLAIERARTSTTARPSSVETLQALASTTSTSVTTPKGESTTGGRISVWILPPEDQNEDNPLKDPVTINAYGGIDSLNHDEKIFLANVVSTTLRPSISTNLRNQKQLNSQPNGSPLFSTFMRQGGLRGSSLRPNADQSDVDGQTESSLVQAAINVTRAVSEFMGNLIQGATENFQRYVRERMRILIRTLTSTPSQAPQI